MRRPLRLALVLMVLGVLVAIISGTFKSIPAGHVGVATLWGKVQNRPYTAGLNVLLNPFYSWVLFDARTKTHEIAALVPAQDRLLVKLTASVQYRLKPEEAPRILEETGTFQQAVDVHLIPNFRAVIRDLGDDIERAEDFLIDEQKERLRQEAEQNLRKRIAPHGFQVDGLLMRDISVPPFVLKAIEERKQTELNLEKKKAELDQFRVEEQQMLASANARRQAAEIDGRRSQIEADAKAYEIQKLSEALANNKSYIQLRAVETLGAIAKDPASKIYFMNGTDTSALPLMQLGENARPVPERTPLSNSLR